MVTRLEKVKARDEKGQPVHRAWRQQGESCAPEVYPVSSQSLAFEEGRIFVLGSRLTLAAGEFGSIIATLGAAPVNVLDIRVFADNPARIEFWGPDAAGAAGTALTPFRSNRLVAYTPLMQARSLVGELTGTKPTLEGRVNSQDSYSREGPFTLAPSEVWAIGARAPSGLGATMDIAISLTVMEITG